MTITVATLRAAGLDAATIVRIVEIADQESRAKVREQNRIRKQNQRARHVVTRDERDMRDNSLSPSSFPPTPPLITTLFPLESSLRSDSHATPVDEPSRAKLFREGKTILASFGIAEKRLGPLLGRWLKECGNDDVGLLAAIQFARERNVADPAAYISASIKGKTHDKRADKFAHWNELADEIEARELAAGIHRSCRP